MEYDMKTQIAIWREKELAGTLTPEELRGAIAALRQDRLKAGETSAASRTKKSAAKKTVDSESLLDQLDML